MRQNHAADFESLQALALEGQPVQEFGPTAEGIKELAECPLATGRSIAGCKGVFEDQSYQRIYRIRPALARYSLLDLICRSGANRESLMARLVHCASEKLPIYGVTVSILIISRGLTAFFARRCNQLMNELFANRANQAISRAWIR